MKKRIIALLLAMLTAVSSVTVSPRDVYAAQGDTKVTDNKNGTFTVEYDNTSKKKVVVQVTKDSVSYKYYLSNGNVTEVIPMTLGNGSYQVLVCENVVDNKYSVKYSTSIDVDLKNENEVFTNPHIIVDYEKKESAIKKAATLCKGKKTDAKKIDAIYKYMCKNYSYDYGKVETVRATVGYIPSVSQTYKKKMGICYDISSLFAAMLRSQGVAAKVVTGYTPAIDTLHAWNEVYDSKAEKWYVIDCTIDMAYYAAGVSIAMKKKASDYSSIKYYH